MAAPMPKVTVLLPVLDDATVVEESVRSLLAQTIDDVEVLVIDRGSADSTTDVVERIGDARVRVLVAPGADVAGARNLAAEQIAAPYVSTMDAGDVALLTRSSRWASDSRPAPACAHSFRSSSPRYWRVMVTSRRAMPSAGSRARPRSC